MKFFATKNLVTLSLEPCEPWKFQPTDVITPQIRASKEDRQNWYQSPTTQHNFYTGIEAHAPNQRVSKENPPRFLHAFPADYDIKIPVERINEVVATMEIKPTFLEKSLGGNFRLIWVLEQPIPVDSREFCTSVLQSAHDWLRLDLLPGLDRKAFEETSRLYCNGCDWTPMGPVVPAKTVQAFFVKCGEKFRFPAGDDVTVPLDLVEKALREKYPSFDWPSSFDLESQGPSFWVPGSVSPQSAIVKAGGMFSFAAHSDKPFYSWSDLLGANFTKKFQDDAIARATADIWWDSKRFWKKKDGYYRGFERHEIDSFFECTCFLSKKPGQNGISPIKAAFEHIFQHQSIASAGPFVFVRPGRIIHEGFPKLNTWTGKPIIPAVGTQVWGPRGGFPFISAWLDQFFATPEQLAHFMAWMKHYFTGVVNYEPQPGSNLVLMGNHGIGKTLANRNLIGEIVGGYVDASDFLVEGGQFNSHLFDKGHWCLDDEAPAHDPKKQARFQMWLKKMAANQQHMVSTKFEKSCMIDFNGRIGCTTNLDFQSSRMIGPLDNTSLDKTSLFRCNTEPTFFFPSRKEILAVLLEERPNFLRYILDWTPPDFCKPNNRYGYEAYHDPQLLDRAHQSSTSASFKEILIDFLTMWFEQNPKAPYWEGSISKILQVLVSTNFNEMVLRNVRVEQVSRYLEHIQREGYLKVEVHQGQLKTRLWRFYREQTNG